VLEEIPRSSSRSSGPARRGAIVSSEPATVVIGTAIGEIHRDRAKLRHGFEVEGARIVAGDPSAYEEVSIGWVIDEPSSVRTRSGAGDGQIRRSAPADPTAMGSPRAVDEAKARVGPGGRPG